MFARYLFVYKVQILKERALIAQAIQNNKAQNKKTGFVPTMGALHNGHLALIDFAFTYCDCVVVSIFVNPTQFNNPDDLKKYPRTLAQDTALLQPYGDTIIVYVPDVTTVYGNITQSKSYNFGSLATAMEGRFRPGHFDGVGTVLNLLFRQLMTDMAFFGEKDFQQLQVVKKLVQIEHLPIQIIGCPIHRQKDGLATSSRNARLTAHQLKIAPFIYQVLKQVQEDFNTKSARLLKVWVAHQFSMQADLELEYFEIANIKNLQPLSRKRKQQKYRAFIAAFAGEVRLVDNIALN